MTQANSSALVPHPDEPEPDGELISSPTPETTGDSADASPTIVAAGDVTSGADSAAEAEETSVSAPTIVSSSRSSATPAAASTTTGSTTTGRASVPTTPGRNVRIGRVGSAAETVGRGVTSAAAVGAARVSETLRTARATVTGAASRGPRRARLHLKRIDPWSVMKFSFAVSFVLFVVAIVATSVLYLALDAMGVFDSVNRAATDITGTTSGDAGFKITAKGVIGTSMLLGAVNMVLFTALATLGAFVYNVCADLVGGVELTLSEKD